MKNKIFPIVCIFLLIVSVFFTNVNADNTNYFVYNGKTYILPDECSNYVVFEFESKLWLYFNNSNFWGLHAGSGYYDLFSYASNSGYGTSDNRVSYSIWTIGLNDTDFSKSINKMERTWGYICYNGLENVKIYSSNVDIHNTDGSIFFQPTPLGITQTLVAETGKAQIMEQIKTMIVGFLKYLIVLVISVIAFYKGWKFLLTQLRKS